MKFFSLLVLLTAGVSEAEAGVVRTFAVGNWKVSAYTADSGRFSHCAAGMKFRSNVTVLFSINKDLAWTIAFHNPAWTFEPGQQVALNLAIDKAPSSKMRAEMFDPSGIVISLEADADLFRRFKSAKRLKISGQKESFEFEMTRMDEMLSKLLACAKEKDGSADAKAAQNPFITTKTGGNEIVAEATAFAANILSEAKISDYRFLGRDEIKQLQGDARWTIPDGGFGYVQVHPDFDMDSQHKLGRQVIAREVQSCDGKFASGSVPDDEKGAGQTFIICDAGEMTFIMYFFVVPRVAGGVYAVSTGFYGRQAAAARAKEEHQKFREAVFAAR
jgi:hypothetical protein